MAGTVIIISAIAAAAVWSTRHPDEIGKVLALRYNIRIDDAKNDNNEIEKARCEMSKRAFDDAGHCIGVSRGIWDDTTKKCTRFVKYH